jgi:hypothetical protein
MHLTAFSDGSGVRWRWKIVDLEGEECASSPIDYPSVSEAFEAGRVAFSDVLRQHTPVSTRRDQALRRRRRATIR